MRVRKFLLACAMLALPLMLVNAAWATSPTITAYAACDTSGKVIITYTSTAWDPTSIYAANSEIDVLFNGVKVDAQPYNAGNNYSFTGSAPAPLSAGPGDTVSVTAFAAGLWYGIYDGGQSSSVTVTIPTEGCYQPGLGRMTGGGFQVRVGPARVSKGLTLHCDLLLSNNLEINWNGHQFHMLEHMQTVACTDDPAITQAPPAAPLDTIIGVGVGRYDNMDGYTVEFTFVDAGEPGTNDEAALKIYQTSNPSNVVLNIPLKTIDGGNLQAHYDQPHK